MTILPDIRVVNLTTIDNLESGPATAMTVLDSPHTLSALLEIFINTLLSIRWRTLCNHCCNRTKMARRRRPPTSGSSTYFTQSKPKTTRPTTSASTVAGDQQVICAITESRGISPVVGLAFVNIYTAEASLCQITDDQNYERTLQKLAVFDPTEVLIARTAASPKSRLLQYLEAYLDCEIQHIERKHWSEAAGLDYIDQLAFVDEVEAIKVSASGNYFAICCLAAVSDPHVALFFPTWARWQQ